MTTSSIRIIGGTWRGRRLKVLDIKHLRPTPDRVRETLFNWLKPHIVGAHCLDLFAGSGALGFEALSRGAIHVDMIDESPETVNLLQQELATFGALEQARIIRAQLPQELPEALLAANHPYDIVFVDPPYQLNLLLPCCFLLEEKKYLAHSAYIYLEANTIIKDNDLPANWRLIKSKRAGQVYYHLASRETHAV